MWFLFVVMILSLTLVGYGGQPSKSGPLDLTEACEWTFNSSSDLANSTILNLVFTDANKVLKSQAGSTVTVTSDNGDSQCKSSPSFFATFGSINSIRGTAVSCEGTFNFSRAVTAQSISGTFASNGWGAPGGTFGAPQLSTANTTWSGNLTARARSWPAMQSSMGKLSARSASQHNAS